MSEKSEKDEEALFKADTVPPPDGESDAYSAPTRVGATAPEVLAALKAAGVPADLLKGLEPAPPSEDRASREVEKVGADEAAAPAPPVQSPRPPIAPTPPRVPTAPAAAEQQVASPPDAAHELADADLEEVPRLYEPSEDEAPTELHKGSTWSQPPEVPMPSSQRVAPPPIAGRAWQILQSGASAPVRPPPSMGLRYAALAVLVLCFVVAIVAALGK